MNPVRYNYLLSCFIFLFVISCSDSSLNESDSEEEIQTIQKESITGVVQKGPFNSGSNVMLFELNASDLSQTGNSFLTQVENHQGQFEISNVELASPFVTFRADGFYFNEIAGEQSSAQLSLQAIANVAEETEINVNVLSHLEKPRIEHLVSAGVEFEEAKKQAQTEILSIFQIVNENATPSEKMNIASSEEGNGILLAISSILQGYRSVAELSELLSIITNDIKENGVLNDASAGSQLINHAKYLNSETIQRNLKQRYADLGIEADIPLFDHHIKNFMQHTSFEIIERLIDYPAEGRHGENILDPNRSSYTTSNNTSYFISLAAELTEGTSLKVKISTLEGTPVAIESMWAYDVMSPINWEVNPYDYSGHSQEFVALESGKESDLRIRFYPGRFLAEYFEMDSEADEPTWSREFTVNYE